MLIREAELLDGRVLDLRLDAGRIAEMAPRLAPRADEVRIEAHGGLLLPGLHDHHLHLYSLAAALDSVTCGPPEVRDAQALRRQLRSRASALAPGAWLRGIGYHESVAGDLDREALDALLPDAPLRIQHRSGRLWLLNSAALAQVESSGGDDPLERREGRATGRLYDADDWLRARLPRQPRSLARVSQRLAGYGVTGVTDTTHTNDFASVERFRDAQQRGELRQRLRLMGDASVDALADTPWLQRGEHKFHLHDHELPDFDALCADIRRAHAAGRGAAFHCVSRVDLVFALQALREAGVRPGDRIEHGSVLPPELLDEVAALRLTVVTQPHFLTERGEVYRREVAAEDQPWLYRLRGVLDAGVPLAAGSDAPFGDVNPWAAMQAAVTRRSADGEELGAGEALTPEQALVLFLGPAGNPGGSARVLAVGGPADLCLLDRPWRQARTRLGAVRVRLTLCEGQTIGVG